MGITDAHNRIDIRLMGLRSQGIAQKNHKVDLIVFDLCSELLYAA